METNFKKQALFLRKTGKTYSEILKEIPVAKSTLSSWLREVGLSKPQKQRITKKRLEAGLRGAQARRMQRVERTKQIQKEAQREIGRISDRELWLIGTALYWAEGSKEKEWGQNIGVSFINTDPYMIRVFFKFLTKVLKAPRSDIQCRIYIHENHTHRLSEVHAYWMRVTGLSAKHFLKTCFKKHKPKTKRQNAKRIYYGIVQIKLKKSSALNRKIAGWTLGIIKNYCRVV